jgi:hypothetical protein
MGLAPDVFWAMSLPEWRAAVDGFAMRRGTRRNTSLSRSELQTMMTMHPDSTSLSPFEGERAQGEASTLAQPLKRIF